MSLTAIGGKKHNEVQYVGLFIFCTSSGYCCGFYCAIACEWQFMMTWRRLHVYQGLAIALWY